MGCRVSARIGWVLLVILTAEGCTPPGTGDASGAGAGTSAAVEGNTAAEQLPRAAANASAGQSATRPTSHPTTGPSTYPATAPASALPEGTFIFDRVGRLTEDKTGEPEFEFESNGTAGKEPPLLLQPSASLMRMEDYVAAHGPAVRFLITGMITQYRGRSYLLLQKVAAVPGAERKQQQLPAPMPRDSTGLVPLDQMKGDAKYKEFDGGLYGSGQNTPPGPQARAATDAAARVLPLDAEGEHADGGKIVLISIGMSNTTMEFSRFKQLADGDQDKSAHLVIVDCAQGGKDAEAWAKVDDSGTNATWQEADRRLKQAGVSPKQVEAVWIKQAIPGPARFGSDQYIKRLQDDLVRILQLTRQHYPNVRLGYLSSRIYGGYATTPLNPEPYAYESAFAVRAAIQRQVEHDPELSAEKAPVVLWGPYLWADGIKGRQSDDLVWKKEDFGADGTHPSPSGRQKVAERLVKFFKTDSSARGWFLKPGGAPAATRPAAITLAQRERVKTDLSTIQIAIDAFEIDLGRYPTTGEGLRALIQTPPNEPNWRGPYLTAIPKDPWGHPYGYLMPGRHNDHGFDLWSLGPDGEGTMADDLSNW